MDQKSSLFSAHCLKQATMQYYFSNTQPDEYPPPAGSRCLWVGVLYICLSHGAGQDDEL